MHKPMVGCVLLVCFSAAKWLARACRNHSVVQNEPRKLAGTFLHRRIGRVNLRGAFTAGEWRAQTRAEHFGSLTKVEGK